MFESPMDLHYSQTSAPNNPNAFGLNPLWIYTTLKHEIYHWNKNQCLNPLWIYTTLKRGFVRKSR